MTIYRARSRGRADDRRFFVFTGEGQLPGPRERIMMREVRDYMERKRAGKGGRSPVKKTPSRRGRAESPESVRLYPIPSRLVSWLTVPQGDDEMGAAVALSRSALGGAGGLNSDEYKELRKAIVALRSELKAFKADTLKFASQIESWTLVARDLILKDKSDDEIARSPDLKQFKRVSEHVHRHVTDFVNDHIDP